MKLRWLLLVLISINSLGQQNKGLRFIENKGQWSESIDFQARVPGGRVGVSSSGFGIYLLDMEEIEHQHHGTHENISEATGTPDNEPISGHYFRINLIGSNTSAPALGQERMSGYYNYFLSSNSTKWVSGAGAFASILYKEVYIGIDLRVSSVGNNLKYDFIVHPGADPNQIRLEYEGTLGLEKSVEDLDIKTAVGILKEEKPFCYQGKGATMKEVASRYKLSGNIVSFTFPEDYDSKQALIIDPLLIFSTFSGSTADNWGSTATPGEHGTLYSAGVTRQDLGGNFPATTGAFQTSNNGSFDMGIIKYDSAGTRFLYATYLGGSNNDSPQSLVVEPISGDLIVLGISGSTDYPTSANAFDTTFNLGTPIFNRVLNTNNSWDIVLTRLSASGNQLIGSTFLGGSGNDGLNIPKQSGGPLVVNYGDEMRGDVITDAAGNVLITSVTSSANFPMVSGFDASYNGGATDGLIVKMSPNLTSILWSSYIGGSGYDASYSIKFDSNFNIVLAGGTTSANFPVTTGSYQTTFNGIVDGWIAKVSSDGTIIQNATFTGTNSFDQIYFIDLNASNHIYCYGQTAGHMPVTSGVFHNPNTGQFLQKFSPDLTTLELSTIFGAPSFSGLVIPNISPTAFLVNDCNNIYMAGWGGFVNSNPGTGFWQSFTNGMPITEDAYQKTTSGSDFYFIVLNGDATELVYSTYLGGKSSKTHVDGGTSRFDKYGIVYHAVCAGCAFGNETGGSSSDFPTSHNAKSRFNLSTNCNNAAFKFDLSSLRAMFDTNNTALTMPGFNNVCDPDSIVFQNLSTGGRSIAWDFGDGTFLNQINTDPRDIIHKYKNEGTYRVKLKITDLSTCSQTDSITKIVKYFVPKITVGADSAICLGTNFRLTASGGQAYTWTSSDGLFTSNVATPIIQPSVTTTYYVSVVDANGCTKSDTLEVQVIEYVRAIMQTYDLNETIPDYNNVCFPESILFKNLSLNGVSYSWEFGDGTLPVLVNNTQPIEHGYFRQGAYKVKLKAFNPGTCNQVDSVEKIINYFQENISAGVDVEICEGTSYRLNATGGNTYLWSTQDKSFTSTQSTPTVQPGKTTNYILTGIDVHGCTGTDTVKVNVFSFPELNWKYSILANCKDRPSVIVENLTPALDDVTYYFDFGDGTITEDKEVHHIYESNGTYSLRFVARSPLCTTEKGIELNIYNLKVPNVFTPEASPGLNDTYQIVFGDENYTPNEAGIQVNLTVVDRWGKKVFESSDYQNNWNGQDLTGGQYFAYIKIGQLDTCKTWLHIIK